MRWACYIVWILWTLSVQSQSLTGELLPPGGGDKIVVFPDGAYVPNAWIDTATDSTAVWQKGNAQKVSAVLRVSSMARENIALQQQRDSLGVANSRNTLLVDSCDARYKVVDLRLGELEDENSKMIVWARVGKWTVGVVVTAVVIIGVREVVKLFKP